MVSSPPENCFALPDPSNILLWYYLLDGPVGTPYEGGVYVGKIRFPGDYPYSPPSIMICTPNGRFKTDTRLCLSISDFHPKEWNPVWNSSTILTGLLSFMTGSDMTYGSMESTNDQKIQFAKNSHQFNVNFPMFEKLFPERYAAEVAKVEARKAAVAAAASSSDDPSKAEGGGGRQNWGMWILQVAVMAGIGLVVGKFWK
jgi:ubiquitin-conjugating enzyme E2 J2